MPFLAQGVTVRSHGDRTWELTVPLIYQGKIDRFVVPGGFITDFASVPRVAVWLIPRFDRYTRAAILHDYLCTQHRDYGLLSAPDVDGIFRRIMRELDVPPVKRWLMWMGVRWSALTDPARRDRWWSTAPAVLGVSVLALPLLIPGVAVALGLLLYGLAEWIATRGRHAGTLNT